jgi:uncharacterized protein
MAETADAHLHLFSREVFGFYGRQAPELQGAADPAQAALARLGVEDPGEPEALAGRWAAELDRHGVGRAVVFGSAPGEQGTVARVVATDPRRFVGFQMVNPLGPGVTAAIDDIAAKGLRGLLLFPALHGFYPDACSLVYEAARRHRLVLFVHLGALKIGIRDKLGVTTPVLDERFGDASSLGRALEAFPDIPFVVPHFGAGRLRELVTVAGRARNLYVDTSSSNSWMAGTTDMTDLETVFRAALDAPALGPERILFGSDSTVFPRGWRADVHAAQRAAVDRLGLSSAETAGLFAGNLDRLLPS